MSRRIPVNERSGNIRCDFCHKQILMGRFAHQVTEGKSQGIFHGRICFEAALKHYEELEKGVGVENSDEEEWTEDEQV